jgi:hypothetical protein
MISQNPVIALLDSVYKDGQQKSILTQHAFRGAASEVVDSFAQQLLDNNGSEDEEEALRSSDLGTALTGLESAVFRNGLKQEFLKGMGDTHFSNDFEEVNSLLAQNGFEKVHTFKFWPVDDQGVEVTTDSQLEENLVIWARRDQGLVVSVESYTASDKNSNYFRRGANTIHLFYAWRDAQLITRSYSLRSNGELVSPGTPNWRQEYRDAVDNGDVYKMPDDLTFVGRYDAREGMFLHIRQLMRSGTLLPTHPPGRDNFGHIYGVGFYTDYKRKEFLGDDGRFNHRNYDGIRELHKQRLAELPQWFREMVGRE